MFVHQLLRNKIIMEMLRNILNTTDDDLMLLDADHPDRERIASRTIVCV